MRPTLRVALSLVFAATAGCGSPASPFDQMKQSTVTVYRLQNYEAAPATAAAAPGASMLPPQISMWLGAGASMLPPGLIPPGLLPGTTTATTAMPDAARFNGFRILAQNNALTDSQKGELADILGFSSSFDDTFSTCMYAEFGVREERVGAPPADLLISLSCDRVQPASGFVWPHKNQGLTSKSVQRITTLMRGVFNQ